MPDPYTFQPFPAATPRDGLNRLCDRVESWLSSTTDPADTAFAIIPASLHCDIEALVKVAREAAR